MKPEVQQSHRAHRRHCMHASTACLLLYEDDVWVSLGNTMKAMHSQIEHFNLNHSPLQQFHHSMFSFAASPHQGVNSSLQ
jgi:hypothetical protein